MIKKHFSLGTIILAAGASVRLGSPKQLARLEGETLLNRTIELASQLPESQTVVVLGAHQELIRPSIRYQQLTFIDNPAWVQGMGSSIVHGAAYYYEHYPDTEYLLFLLCDQIYVSVELLNEMRDTAIRTNAPVIACSYANSLGVPAMFHRSLFRDLLKLPYAAGAKKLIMQYLNDCVAVPFPQGKIDIDTTEEALRRGVELFKNKAEK
ncbi:nucleotidyltransferase family protein [Rapidithrix thailandica]|uniref:Nucleotidyltransferase family protein n=1 Tax=Rapidithrix thailandica TaxID=413964 RepID=A0AAW9SHU9_9BACT